MSFCGIPVAQSLDPILADSRVTFARRLTKSAGHGRGEPTRQVEVSFRGALPVTLYLVFWGGLLRQEVQSGATVVLHHHVFGHVKK